MIRIKCVIAVINWIGAVINIHNNKDNDNNANTIGMDSNRSDDSEESVL